jgi:prepilin-type N-terminal cleavage/methylation domain-containing protein
MSIKNDGGFTLIELLVVITIIGLLSTVAVIALTAARDEAKTTKVMGDLSQIRLAIEFMATDTDQWPGHQAVDVSCADPGPCPANNELCDTCTFSLSSGFGGLTQNDGGTAYTNWNGPYMGLIPLDPWGNEYFFDTDYDVDPTGARDWKVVIGSYGPNGLEINGYDETPNTSLDDIITILVE